MRSGTRNSVGGDRQHSDLVSGLLALAPYTLACVEHLSYEILLPLIMGKTVKKGTSAFFFSREMLILSNDFKATALNTTENFGHLFLLMCLFNWSSIVISAREHKLREGRKGACWTVLLLRYDSCQENVSRLYIRNVSISL